MSGCAFDLGLEINFPCPSISGSGAGSTEIVEVGEESATLLVTKEDECTLDFNLDIKFPCPTIALTPTSSTTAGYPGVFTIEEGAGNNPANCEFEFDLEIKFPCPAITKGSQTKSVVEIGSESANLGISKIFWNWMFMI